uniref:Uncharacterized protein n=1 Tax=Lactuca sativa TaxID=4236 RepID=A0A9R1WVI4_LACSA|nr:hypothetical protein LSAT_V11C900506320 [Lactuca sativa]
MSILMPRLETRSLHWVLQKACDCRFPACVLTSTTPKNLGRHFMVCNELDVEPVQIPVIGVVEGMKADLVALKTEVKKVKEDMEQMKKEKYSDVIVMKEKLYNFPIGFILLIIL